MFLLSIQASKHNLKKWIWDAHTIYDTYQIYSCNEEIMTQEHGSHSIQTYIK